MDYYDSVVIERFAGSIDSNGEEVRDLIYSGEGLLQLASMTSNKHDGYQFEHEPLLFIPVNDILFKINDTVAVTTLNERVLEYTLLNYESIKDDDYPELNDTCIWLKDGKDVL